MFGSQTQLAKGTKPSPLNDTHNHLHRGATQMITHSSSETHRFYHNALRTWVLRPSSEKKPSRKDPAGPKGRGDHRRDSASDSWAPRERQKQTTQKQGRGRSQQGGIRASQIAQSQKNARMPHHFFLSKNQTKPSSSPGSLH